MDTIDQATFWRMLKEVLLEVAREVFALRPAALVRPDPNAEAVAEKILLRPSEAAKALAISERHLSKLCNAGKIPCVRITRLVRYDPAAQSIRVALPESARMLDVLHDRPPRAAPPKMSRSTPTAAPLKPRAKKSREAKPASTSRSAKSAIATEATPKPRFAHEYFAERLGVRADRFPDMTNGELKRIAGVDTPTLHGWTWHNREMPPDALQRLHDYFASLIAQEAQPPL